MFTNLALRVFCLLAVLLECSASISCKDNNGQDVDWWIIYKLPKIRNSSKRDLSSGSSFLYMDVNQDYRWMASSVPIDSNSSTALYNTMAQYYAQRSDSSVYHMLYNDEPPNGSTSESHAHAKGVQLFDSSTGFWLLHSVPKFAGGLHFYYPSNGYNYGQSFICVTFESAAVLPHIGTQMMLYHPDVYAKWLPASYKTAYPSLWNAIIEGQQVKEAPFNNTVVLTSKAGTQFVSFGKSKDWGKDLYAGMVTPFVRETMYVEGWVDGSGDLPDDCTSQYNTINIASLTLNSITFTTTKDHSKWTVSETSEKAFICVGDINRQEHQKDRGGGTLCFSNLNVWHAYKSAITTTQPCP